MFPRCPNIPLVYQLLLGVLFRCRKLYSSHHVLNNAKKLVLKKYLIVNGGGEYKYSIRSGASISPAPQRWFMMYWMTFRHLDVGRKGRIVSHHHHFVVVCKLPNQSHPLHKVIPISKNRRYYNFSSARVLFCGVPTGYVSKGSLNSPGWQWYRVALTHPIIWDIKNDRHLTFLGLHNIPRT